MARAKKPRTITRTARAPATDRRRAPAHSDPAAQRVTIRHYCQGIGDCHLLRLPRGDGGDFWVLIDCGVHLGVKGGSDKIAQIVKDITTRTSRIDVLVVTHEHWDHVSGFFSQAEAFGRLKVGEVWMGWCENPEDEQAQQLDKFKAQAFAALQTANAVLERPGNLTPHLSVIQKGLQGLLAFNVGAKGEKVRAGRDAAAALAPGRVRYLEPGQAPIPLPAVPALRVYVLGPPRDAKLLGVTKRASEMYGVGGAGGWPLAAAISCAFTAREGTADDDSVAPFDPELGTRLSDVLDANTATEVDAQVRKFVQQRYAGPSASPTEARRGRPSVAAAEADQSWRRIDMDWLAVSADLAIQLDQRTNNSSLVLAFEFVETKRVMLFVGDAQVGNWLSWQDLKWNLAGGAISGPDLLARTVYYKVGHHGSENATLKQKGLELMTSPDLAAFVPTNQADAKKIGWGEMPFEKILDELHRRARGRVVRADDPWIAEQTMKIDFAVPSGSIHSIRHQKDLWVELDVA